MADIVSDFISWMETLPAIWAYGVVLVIAYGENVIPPIPGDMIVIFGGYLAGLGQIDLGVVIVMSTIGGALGFMTMYALGYWLGEAVLRPDRFTWIPQGPVDKVERWLHRWGYGVVAANRFLSGARSVISLTVGMARMAPWQTAWWCTLSAAVWTSLIAYAGYAVGDNWPVVVRYLQLYGWVVLGVIGLVVAVLLVRAYGRHPAGAEAGGAAGREEGARREEGS